MFEKGSSQYDEHIDNFQELPGARSIIHVELDLIRDSCGYSIPLYENVGDRDVLTKWSENKGEDGVKEYIRQNNRTNLDGMPGIDAN